MNDTPHIPKATQIIVLSDLFTCYLKNELSDEFNVSDYGKENRYTANLCYEIYFENIKLSTTRLSVLFDLPTYLCDKDIVDKCASKEIYNCIEEYFFAKSPEEIDFFVKIKQHIKDLNDRIELGNMFSDVTLKQTKTSKI